MPKVAVTKEEVVRRVVKFFRDYQKYQGRSAMPFYFVARKYGKLCAYDVGIPLQEVLEESGLFIVTMNEGGGAQISLRELSGAAADELIQTDPKIKRLAEVQARIKARGLKPDRALMETEWKALFNEEYPFPVID